MSIDKMKHVTPLRRLAIFLEALDQGRTIEIDGIVWRAGENSKGTFVPCMVLEKHESDGYGNWNKVDDFLSDPQATIPSLLSMLDKWGDSELMGLIAGNALMETKQKRKVTS